ncbi:3-oxoacyl-[acyl-carrier-protein] reductase FabG [Baekduia alba]|uniref:SDR family NAD(P)-dependent oxidoreductase n=1 Tax=Baekduia alba TaxID=2997333 RepID=UPI0023421E36|nr:SDR family NAD(P)-dependent oxidoreductase [Baekduia alba]WCB94831.1 3-oxoacyl-[acyl-carrier-protein] reductase FabG [Baekduia alba]
MDLGLDGRVCVVTGASRGIGLAVSSRLVAEGARVLMVARDAERLSAAADDLGAEWLAADVTDPGCDERIVATATEQLGAIDVLVNNAGTSRNAGLDELSDADWRDQHELHVMAPMRLMRLAAPRMAERGWGRIVNVTSSSGKRPSASNMAYSVAKAGQLSLSRAFADVYAARGVAINAVAPGATGTELWLGDGGLADQAAAAKGISRDEALAQAAAKLPRGRLGDPQEVADVIVFLCGERAANVVGAAWGVDGGAVNIMI